MREITSLHSVMNNECSVKSQYLDVKIGNRFYQRSQVTLKTSMPGKIGRFAKIGD